MFSTFLPVHSIRTRHCPLSPWFDAECRALRRRARCLERIYRRTQSSSDRADWIRFVRNMHSFYRTRGQEYWEAVINRHSREPKKLWTKKKRTEEAVSTTSLAAGRVAEDSRLRHLFQLMFSWRDSQPRSRPSVRQPLQRRRGTIRIQATVSLRYVRSLVLSCECLS